MMLSIIVSSFCRLSWFPSIPSLDTDTHCYVSFVNSSVDAAYFLLSSTYRSAYVFMFATIRTSATLFAVEQLNSKLFIGGLSWDTTDGTLSLNNLRLYLPLINDFPPAFLFFI